MCNILSMLLTSIGQYLVISLHRGIKFILLDYCDYRYTDILLITFFCGLEVSMKL